MSEPQRFPNVHPADIAMDYDNDKYEDLELREPGESSPFIDPEDEDLKEELNAHQMDTGLVAWIQCASSFALSMGTWGLGNSYGM